MLAEHPDVLARLRDEVLKTVGPHGKVSPESLREMKYLRAVLDGKRFTKIQRSSHLICHRDVEAVSKRVRIIVRSYTYSWLKKRQSVEYQMLQERGGVASSRWRQANIRSR